MAISLITSGSLVATSTTSTTITDIQADDLVIFARAADATTYAAPTGFTNGNDSGASSFPTTGWAYTFATASSIEVTGLTGLPNNQTTAWIWMVFRGVDTTTPINASGSFINSTSTNANANPPAVTTTEDNCAIVIIGALDDDTGTTVVSVPSGYTLIIERNAGGAAEASATIASAYKIQSTAGSEDPGNIVFSSTDLWTTFTIALQAAPETPCESLSTGSISLDEVRLYLNLETTASLQDCFGIAVEGYFDTLYSGSKDRLSNFKGYSSC